MKSFKEKWNIILLCCFLIVGCIFFCGCAQKNPEAGIVDEVKTDQNDPMSTQVPYVITTSPENNPQRNGSAPEVSISFHTEKNISYEEMKEWEKNYTAPPTIPKTEMALIIFSKTWFLQNDADPRQDLVQVTFPRTWLDKSPANDNEPVVLLQMPKRELELVNSNSDPKMVTIIYRAERFSEFPNMTAASHIL